MSKEIGIIENTGVQNDRNLQIIAFYGGEINGTMIQLTQGSGGHDKPGYVQLTITDLLELMKTIENEYF